MTDANETAASPAFDRRTLLKAVPCLAIACGAAGQAAAEQPAEPSDARPTVPFMYPVTNWPGETVYAACWPAARVNCDSRYLLSDGRMIMAMIGPYRVDEGDGWQMAERANYDPRIIGRVRSLHRLDASGWHELGAGWYI